MNGQESLGLSDRRRVAFMDGAFGAQGADAPERRSENLAVEEEDGAEGLVLMLAATSCRQASSVRKRSSLASLERPAGRMGSAAI